MTSAAVSSGSVTSDEMVEQDLQLMWTIQDAVYRRPWLDSRMSRIISKYPWNDICILVYLVSLVGVFEIGVRHFWVVATNLVVCYASRTLISAKRPVEYDSRLRPTTDLLAGSHGFPSVESYMSVVIIGHIFLRLPNNTPEETTFAYVFLCVGLVLISLVGFSRIYSRARFPHQIVGSWALGTVGLVAGTHYCERINGGFQAMSHHTHGVCVGFVVAIFLAVRMSR
jgi:membrane-associated phospholipid phosphatase